MDSRRIKMKNQILQKSILKKPEFPGLKIISNLNKFDSSDSEKCVKPIVTTSPVRKLSKKKALKMIKQKKRAESNRIMNLFDSVIEVQSKSVMQAQSKHNFAKDNITQQNPLGAKISAEDFRALQSNTTITKTGDKINQEIYRENKIFSSRSATILQLAEPFQNKMTDNETRQYRKERQTAMDEAAHEYVHQVIVSEAVKGGKVELTKILDHLKPEDMEKLKNFSGDFVDEYKKHLKRLPKALPRSTSLKPIQEDHRFGAIISPRSPSNNILKTIKEQAFRRKSTKKDFKKMESLKSGKSGKSYKFTAGPVSFKINLTSGLQSRNSVQEFKEKIIPNFFTVNNTMANQSKIFTPMAKDNQTESPRRKIERSISTPMSLNTLPIKSEHELEVQISNDQSKIIELIQRQIPKSENEIAFMMNYFYKFDFLQGQQIKKENIFKKNDANTMAKDSKSIEQMCKVTKHLFVQRNRIVFDYESQGDLFYMVISGKVICKVPFHKQVVQLSDDEKQVFMQEFKEDILDFREATDIQRQIEKDLLFAPVYSENSLKAKIEKEVNPILNDPNRIDLAKLQYLKNPYDLDQSALQQYIIKMIQTEKQKTLDKIQHKREQLAAKRAEMRKSMSPEAVQISDESSSEETSSINTSYEEESDGEIQKKQQSEALKDARFKKLKECAEQLLQTPYQGNRRYYYVNIMKIVKTYNEYTSFGELALLTNKRRKAKLETLTDTNFAVLSKIDYRQAQYKAQNQVLKAKINFLSKFNIFANLSEQNLNLLSYSMEDQIFYRGQTVYEEGVHTVDKIYLIRDGDFELSKQLIRPIKKVADGQVKSYFNNQESVGFSYKKLNNQKQFNTYSSFSKPTSHEDLQICLLGNLDIFGYQELLEKDIQVRSCTVKCLRNESHVVTISVNSLVALVRRSPKVLEDMKLTWTQFLVQRVTNKLFVEQITTNPEQNINEIFKKSQIKAQKPQETSSVKNLKPVEPPLLFKSKTALSVVSLPRDKVIILGKIAQKFKDIVEISPEEQSDDDRPKPDYKITKFNAFGLNGYKSEVKMVRNPQCWTRNDVIYSSSVAKVEEQQMKYKTQLDEITQLQRKHMITVENPTSGFSSGQALSITPTPRYASRRMSSAGIIPSPLKTGNPPQVENQKKRQTISTRHETRPKSRDKQEIKLFGRNIGRHMQRSETIDIAVTPSLPPLTASVEQKNSINETEILSIFNLQKTGRSVINDVSFNN